jgi:hypothetical protein
MPLPLDDSIWATPHVVQLWFARDNQEVSAKLMGAVEGEERQVLWDELKQFVIVEGKEAGDDDDDDNREDAG